MDIIQCAQKLKTDIPAIFIALKHKDTPLAAKIVAGITVGYALSPVDLVPDFIPVLGYFDDIIILPALIALTIRLIPAPVFEQCRKESEDIWKEGQPRKWVCAIPIIVIWLLIIWIIVKKVVGWFS